MFKSTQHVSQVLHNMHIIQRTPRRLPSEPNPFSVKHMEPPNRDEEKENNMLHRQLFPAVIRSE
jgi:hypothetical protein